MNEAVKAEVMAAVGKWRSRLRLNDWAITYDWNAKLDDDTVMECTTQQQYRRVTLKVRAETKHDGSWNTIEKQVLHELCHCLVAEMIDVAQTVVGQLKPGVIAYDLAEAVMHKADERTTEWVARVVWKAHEGTEWDEEPAHLTVSEVSDIPKA